MLLLEVAVVVVLAAIAVALAITMDLYQIMEVMEVVDQLSMAGMEWDKQLMEHRALEKVVAPLLEVLVENRFKVDMQMESPVVSASEEILFISEALEAVDFMEVELAATVSMMCVVVEVAQATH